MLKLKAEPWTMEGFVEDLEELAQDHNPERSPEYTAMMEAAAYLREFTHGIGLDRLREICAAERDGRCVVIPCKVGDTVKTRHGDAEVVCWDTTARVRLLNEFDFAKRYRDYDIGSKVFAAPGQEGEPHAEVH